MNEVDGDAERGWFDLRRVTDDEWQLWRDVRLRASVKEMNTPAAALYRRMGFVQTDERANEGDMRMQVSLQ